MRHNIPVGITLGTATSDRVAIPNSAAIQITEASTFTWLVWFMLTTFTATRTILRQNAQDGAGGPLLHLSGTTEVEFRCARATTNDICISNNAALALNTPYCIMAVRDPNASVINRIFLGTQGKALTELTYGTSSSGSGSVTTTAPLTIGNRSGASISLALQGTIWAVTVSKQALTLAEGIRWQTAYTPDLPLTVGSWRPGMWGTDGLVQDDSMHANFGTIIGGIPQSGLFAPRVDHQYERIIYRPAPAAASTKHFLPLLGCGA